MLTPQTRTLEILRGRYDPGTDTGYMGYIPASDFITGVELIELLDFRDGTDQNSDAGWLKFYVGPTAACNSTPGTAKCIFIAKQSFKYTVSWDQINSAGLVYGTTSRTVLGQSYNVRIMTGGEASPGTGSEWNELIYRVHAEQPESKSNWETFDPAADTNITNGNGRYVWCQENPPSKPTERVTRGGNFTSSSSNASSIAHVSIGWRPVLELAG